MLQATRKSRAAPPLPTPHAPVFFTLTRFSDLTDVNPPSAWGLEVIESQSMERGVPLDPNGERGRGDFLQLSHLRRDLPDS